MRGIGATAASPTERGFPLVTVAMPVRDGERWLPAALESLRRQTFTDFEVVAVDDGSRDDTSGVLEAAEDLPLRVIQTGGVGVAAARNLILESAHGQLIAQLDGDDEWRPWYLERIVPRFEDESVAIVACELELAFGGSPLGRYYFRDATPPLRWFDRDQLERLARFNFISPCASYRRAHAVEAGGYREELHAGEDWDLWLRMVAAGGRALLEPTVCATYRLSGTSITSGRTALVASRIVVLEWASEHLAHPASAQAATELAYQRFQLHITKAKDALLEGDRGRAREHLKEMSRSVHARPRQRLMAVSALAFPGFAGALLRRRVAGGTRGRSPGWSELRRARE